MIEMLFLDRDEAGDVAGAGELLLLERHAEKHKMCSK